MGIVSLRRLIRNNTAKSAVMLGQRFASCSVCGHCSASTLQLELGVQGSIPKNHRIQKCSWKLWHLRIYLFHDRWGYLLKTRPRRTIIFARFALKKMTKQLFILPRICNQIPSSQQLTCDTRHRCASFARVGPCLVFAASWYWRRRWVLFCSRWSIISFHGSSFQSNLRRGTCHHGSYLQTC